LALPTRPRCWPGCHRPSDGGCVGAMAWSSRSPGRKL